VTKIDEMVLRELPPISGFDADAFTTDKRSDAVLRIPASAPPQAGMTCQQVRLAYRWRIAQWKQVNIRDVHVESNQLSRVLEDLTEDGLIRWEDIPGTTECVWDADRREVKRAVQRILVTDAGRDRLAWVGQLRPDERRGFDALAAELTTPQREAKWLRHIAWPLDEGDTGLAVGRAVKAALLELVEVCNAMATRLGVDGEDRTSLHYRFVREATMAATPSIHEEGLSVHLICEWGRRAEDAAMMDALVELARIGNDLYEKLRAPFDWREFCEWFALRVNQHLPSFLGEG
jgi:hypothetical protein